MYKLTTETTESGRTIRTYHNDQYNTTVRCVLLLTDRHKNKWWGFEDLQRITFIRSVAANHIIRLFGHGLQLSDLQAQYKEIRAIAGSGTPDALQRITAKTYEYESVTEAFADPVKQCIGLGTLYLLLNDERPDVYQPSEQAVKISFLTLDMELQRFFLSWWGGIIERYGGNLNSFSQIALNLTHLM